MMVAQRPTLRKIAFTCVLRPRVNLASSLGHCANIPSCRLFPKVGRLSALLYFYPNFRVRVTRDSLKKPDLLYSRTNFAGKGHYSSMKVGEGVWGGIYLEVL